MDTPLESRRVHGPTPRCRDRQAATILGSLTIPGRPDRASGVRAFIARTLAAASRGRRVDSDAATLLTSELVTNAILHTASGSGDGMVTVVVVDVPDGVLIEVTDDGCAGMPVVKGDLFAANGHGLYMVRQLAAQWGYLRCPAGTTVWFHLAAGQRAGYTLGTSRILLLSMTCGRRASVRADLCRRRPQTRSRAVGAVACRITGGRWSVRRSCLAFRAGASSA